MHGWTHIYEEKVAGFRVYLYTTWDLVLGI
jgi:hypothetical protein